MPLANYSLASRLSHYIHDSTDGGSPRASNLVENAIEATARTRARDNQYFIEFLSSVHLVAFRFLLSFPKKILGYCDVSWLVLRSSWKGCNEYI